MTILGVYYGHNATVTLYKDGEVLESVSEERFTGIKNQAGTPEKSINHILKKYKLNSKNIDLVVFPVQKSAPIFIAGKSGNNLVVKTINTALKKLTILKRTYGFVSFYNPLFRPFGRFIYKILSSTVGIYCANLEHENIIKILNIKKEKIKTYDHHLCHAYSAYYGSPYAKERCLVLTLDAEGDGLCATVNVFDGNSYNRLSETYADNSPGWFYTDITEYLGMTPREHEYKVMGLAPYAKENNVKKVYDKYSDFFILGGKDNLQFISKIDTRQTSTFIRQELKSIRFDILAGFAQKITEDIITKWVQQAIKITGINTVCLAGGVFMNVKVNQKIAELTEVEKLFIFPSCGDESTPLGACYIAEKQFNKKSEIKPITTIYWGEAFSNNEIKAYLKTKKIDEEFKVEYCKNIEERIAQLLSNGKVVANMAGRMEWGARALGNRSILANPSNTDVVMVLNEQMKDRDFWMPFTPSILEERANDYVMNPKKLYAPYMIITFDSTTLARKELKAALHPYDFTARPQFVRKSWNPRYHKILKEFEKLTGIGGVLNTSFNLHGYPIVLGPAEALHAFRKSGLEFLALENYLISKS